MKKKHFRLLKTLIFGVLLCSAAACSDDVDESNLYSFHGDMIAGYLQANKDYSDYYNLLTQVRLSNHSNSTVAELLSARGNYTVFVPNNEALRTYVDSLMNEENYDLNLLTDSIKEHIVRNSIIDNGSQDAYRSTDFNVEGALGKTNMNDRYVTIEFSATDEQAATIVNTWSRIIVPDIEVENGVIHIVDHVVSATMAMLPSLIDQTPNIKLFARMLRETGWSDSMLKYIDEDYEAGHIESIPAQWTENPPIETAKHRKFGYTAFIEPDELYEKQWNLHIEKHPTTGEITNWEELLPAIQSRCESMYYYGKAQRESRSNDAATNLHNPDNAINQFVAYHLLNQSIPFNRLVIHFNEMGYSYLRPENLTLNCTSNYQTMGKERRLIYIVEGKATNGKYINRRSEYDNGRTGTYDELTVLYPGIKVENGNEAYAFNALNGNYYLIDDILEYDQAHETWMANHRFRFDYTDFVPEISSNNYRRPEEYLIVGILNEYTDMIDITEDTYLYYSAEYEPQGWRDWMGDQLQCHGQYDITFKLPRVPATGTYELRMACSNNPYRGLAQFYLGTDKHNLTAIGLPHDMRLKGIDPQVGWEADTDDELVNLSIDKAMRNHGYMKAPQFTGLTSGSGVTTSLRAVNGSGNSTMRRIITTQTFYEDKVYYLRLKSLLENNMAQCFIDYFEFVPKGIIGTTEDTW